MKRIAILILFAACGPKAAPATTPPPDEEATVPAEGEGDPEADAVGDQIADDEAYYACVDDCMKVASGEGSDVFCQESCSDDGEDDEGEEDEEDGEEYDE